MYKNLQQYLRAKREALGLTQRELAEKLKREHPKVWSSFESDGARISRWENGASIKWERMMALFVFFGDDPIKMIRELNIPIPSNKELTKLLDQVLKNNRNQGFHPYIDDDTPYKAISVSRKMAAEFCISIARHIKSYTSGRERWITGNLERLIMHPSSTCIRYDASGQMMGHLILIRLKPEYYDEITSNKIQTNEISPEHCAFPGEPHVLYLLTSYMGSRVGIINMHTTIANAVCSDPNCMGLLIRVRNNLGYKLAGHYNMTMVSLGKRVENDTTGVRHNNKYYNSVDFHVEKFDLLTGHQRYNLQNMNDSITTE
ncbi:MAG: helix-turn-helix transcriptional regulator [Pseudomonadales bacterium]|nr:helix-turn-helix transcriptional regulator [Pseudomonadales bacterium]